LYAPFQPGKKTPLGPVSSVMHRIGATAIGVSSAWLEGSQRRADDR
jgi:hypothetical protein